MNEGFLTTSIGAGLECVVNYEYSGGDGLYQVQLLHVRVAGSQVLNELNDHCKQRLTDECIDYLEKKRK